MLQFVIRQMKERRVKNRARITDQYTPKLLEFERLSQQVENGQVLVPATLRADILTIRANTTHLISFRYLNGEELKKMGRK